MPSRDTNHARRVTVEPAAELRGTLSVPGDKSISHRAVLFNALAGGQATIRNFLPGDDCLATVAALRSLGVAIEVQPSADEPGGRADQLDRDARAGGVSAVVTVRSPGAAGWQEPDDVIDCANSGTTMRLLAGALAGRPFLSVLTGDPSLRRRPMRRVIEPLHRMGAELAGRAGDTLAPLVIRGGRGGRLRGITYQTPVASAQVKSAILLAGLSADSPTRVVEPSLSRDHTERLLAALGARLDQDHLPDGSHQVTIQPEAELRAIDLTVPGDLSSAAFWLIAGLAHPQARLRLAGIGLNPSRTGLIDALHRMGGQIAVAAERLIGGEPVADLTVESSDLRAIEVGADLIPRLIDEVPALAVAACFARGRTVIRDAQELRVKESDRIQTIAAELSKIGARISERPDGLEIEGTGRLAGGATVDSHGDHRVALALAMAGLLADAPITITGADAVAVSYPGFWDTFERVLSAEY